MNRRDFIDRIGLAPQVSVKGTGVDHERFPHCGLDSVWRKLLLMGIRKLLPHYA